MKEKTAELNEAEWVEEKDISHRERVVAHGAKPEIIHLGGHNLVSKSRNVFG